MKSANGKPPFPKLNDPEFIAGVSGYCDRWCKRCPLRNRCYDYAMEKAGHRGYVGQNDMLDMTPTYNDRLADFRASARAFGRTWTEEEMHAAVAEWERKEREREAQGAPLLEAAQAYANAVTVWMTDVKPVLEDNVNVWDLERRLAVAAPDMEETRFSDRMELLQRFSHLTARKVWQGVDSWARDGVGFDEEPQGRQKYCDGTAKVALIAMDRSVGAWANLLEVLGDDGDEILNLLCQLTALRAATERFFPDARAFVRPGFDELPRT